MKRLLLLPLFAFIFAPYAQAQNSSSSDGAAIKNTLGLGPRVGYYKANEASEGNYFFGLQTRLRFGKNWGLEGSIEYRAGQEYEIGSQTYQTKFIPVKASAMLFLPFSRSFVPYGVAGLGAYYRIFENANNSPNLDLSDEEFTFGYHLGFGIEFPLGSNAALNIDYRYLFLNPEDNETSTQNADYSGNTATAGLMFYF